MFVDNTPMQVAAYSRHIRWRESNKYALSTIQYKKNCNAYNVC